jgi:hypothetical protein
MIYRVSTTVDNSAKSILGRRQEIMTWQKHRLSGIGILPGNTESSLVPFGVRGWLGSPGAYYSVLMSKGTWERGGIIVLQTWNLDNEKDRITAKRDEAQNPSMHSHSLKGGSVLNRNTLMLDATEPLRLGVGRKGRGHQAEFVCDIAQGLVGKGYISTRRKSYGGAKEHDVCLPTHVMPPYPSTAPLVLQHQVNRWGRLG